MLLLVVDADGDYDDADAKLEIESFEEWEH